MFYFNIGHYCNAKFKLCLKSKIEHTTSKIMLFFFLLTSLLIYECYFQPAELCVFLGFMCCAFVKKINKNK